MAAFAPTVAVTADLLRDIRAGDRDAERRLYERCLPMLRRWAHGRMPRAVRELGDTDDLVQAALLRALRHLHEFEASGGDSFLAHLRHTLLDEAGAGAHRHRRRDGRFDGVPGDADDSAVGNLVGHERMRAYEEALASLDRRQQELVVMRLEFGMDDTGISLETGADPDAVRIELAHALKAMTRHIVAARAG